MNELNSPTEVSMSYVLQTDSLRFKDLFSDLASLRCATTVLVMPSGISQERLTVIKERTVVLLRGTA